MFSTLPRCEFSFCVTLILTSASALNLDGSKLLYNNMLTLYYTTNFGHDKTEGIFRQQIRCC